MSNIDDAFAQSRIDFGLKQKPNWNGTVYGACQTRMCANQHKVGYYEGGFCKICSLRHEDDRKLPVLSGVVGGDGYNTTIPNPRIRWVSKAFIKDLSHNLSGSERQEFYMTPAQLAKKQDSTSYLEKDYDPNEGISTPKVAKKKKEEDWYE
jgi:hypothetical protein